MGPASRRKEDESTDSCKGHKIPMCLTIFLLLLILLLLSTFLFLIGVKPTYSEHSEEIAQIIDESTDPCKDFHDFVCGDFLKTNQSPLTPLEAEFKKFEANFRLLIQEPHQENENEFINLQKTYYQKCLNLQEIDDDNDETFFSLIKEVNGWPLLKQKIQNFDWLLTMIKFSKVGLPSNWFFTVGLYNAGRYQLQISLPKTCHRYFNWDDYRNVILMILSNVTGSPKHNLMVQVQEIVEFEKQLLQICTKAKNGRVLINTVHDLETIWPDLNWIPLMKSLTEGAIKWRRNSKVVFDSDYISRVRHLLSRTSKEIQANFILWKVIEEFAPFLSKPIRDSYFSYLEDQGEDITRSEFCFKDTRTKFPHLSEIIIFEKYKNQKGAAEIIQNIINELLSKMEKQSNWQIVEHPNVTIGVPTEEFSPKYVYIQKLNFQFNGIVRMITEIAQVRSYYNFKLIGKSSIPWLLDEEGPFEIFVNFETGQIFLPETMLFEFLYNQNRPHFLNYASLGAVAAFSLNNKLQNFSQETILIKNSINVAYEAYQKWVNKNGEETWPTGSKFTPRQLFWIKSNFNWCSHNSKNIINSAMKNSSAFRVDFKC